MLFRPFLNLRTLFTSLTAILAMSSCAPRPSERSRITELEVREDGLTYAKGSSTPYTGDFVRLGKTGVKLDELNYVDGKQHGPSFSYAKDGSLRRRTDFDHGIKLRKQVWYSNGQMKADEPWNGIAVFGICTYWFEDGRIRKQFNMSAEYKADGHVLEFAPDGTVLIDAICEKGILVSGKCEPSLLWNISGRYSQEDVNTQRTLEERAAAAAAETAELAAVHH